MIVTIASVRRHDDEKIEIRADDGSIGWGEGTWDDGAMALIGRSPFEVEAIFDELRAGGVDIALWNLCAASAGLPLHRLVGKQYRDRIAIGKDGYAVPFEILIGAVQSRTVNVAIADAAECGVTGLKRLAYLCWLFHVRLAVRCADEITTQAAAHVLACVPPTTNALAAPAHFLIGPAREIAL